MTAFQCKSIHNRDGSGDFWRDLGAFILNFKTNRMQLGSSSVPGVLNSDESLSCLSLCWQMIYIRSKYNQKNKQVQKTNTKSRKRIKVWIITQVNSYKRNGNICDI